MIDLGCTDPADAAAQASALKQFTKHMSEAPQLAVPDIELLHAVSQEGMPWREVGDSLQLLGTKLTQLTLTSFNAGDPDITLLRTLLPRLDQLIMNTCGISDAMLPVLLSTWPGLRLYTARGCEGLTTYGWYALAAGRQDPLTVSVRNSGIDSVTVGRCQRLQQRLFGKLTITWLLVDA